jgi:trans-2,3-dihydro-3-hydroxyanthranilate isomerase
VSALSSKSVPYVIVDVFTERPFAGNPLAVVLDGESLTDEQMQQIARQFNLSETAFPLRPSDAERAGGADYRLRIFTPAVEVPFAGHPSVGTAWLLARQGRIGAGTVQQLCGVGLLPVDVDDRGATLTGGPVTVAGPVDAELALSAVGLKPADLADSQIWITSTGLAYAILFVLPGAVARCAPDMQLLRAEFAYPQAATGVYVVEWDADRRHARARMFAGDIGSPEDPATGSAALALGVRLVHRGDFGDGVHTFTIEQGVDMGRPSSLTVTCDVSAGEVQRVRVTGGAALVAEGRIAVPAV